MSNDKPMSWDEYKRLGPHAGPYSLRDIGIGVAMGIVTGGAIALAVPPAALWLTVGGAIMGGTIGVLPSIMKNQVDAYQNYLAQFNRVDELSKSSAHVIEQARSMHEGIHVARLEKEAQQTTFVPFNR